MKPFNLTLLAILILVAMGIVSALFINTGTESGQRFLILIGIIGTAITALLAVYRSEANAERIETRTNELSAELGRRAQRVEDTARADLKEVKRKIDDNTEVSTAAFHAANDYAARLKAQEKFLTDKFDRLLAESGHAETPIEAEDREVGDTRRALQADRERQEEL